MNRNRPYAAYAAFELCRQLLLWPDPMIQSLACSFGQFYLQPKHLLYYTSFSFLHGKPRYGGFRDHAQVATCRLPVGPQMAELIQNGLILSQHLFRNGLNCGCLQLDSWLHIRGGESGRAYACRSVRGLSPSGNGTCQGHIQ